MKNYERPMVVVNEGLSEGVYLASGTCYSASCKIHQTPQTGRGDYRIQMNAQHAASDDHHSGKQTFVVTFNQPVTYQWSNGKLASGDGTATLRIEFSYHNNAYDNIGAGDLIVTSDAGLSVLSTTVECNRDCGQH